jgi:hypothetical protein
MKSKSKVVLAVLLGVLVLTAIASSSASAITCKTKAGSKDYQICISGSEVNEKASLEAPTKLTSTFVLGLTAFESSIVCTSMSGGGSFKLNGLSEPISLGFGELVLGGCSLQGGALAKRCSISSGMYSDGNVSGAFGSIEAIALKAPQGTFFTFTFSNKGSETCPNTVAGYHEATGSYECKLQAAATEAVEHELKCATSAEHKLRTWDETEDTLSYTQTIALGGAKKGDKFSIYEAT